MTDDLKKATHKVCVLPYRSLPGSHGEVLQFLVQHPQPKRGGAPSKMQWGLARGTAQYFDDTLAQWCDIPSRKFLKTISSEQAEDHWQAASREAHEELGVPPAAIEQASVQDHGLLQYQSPDKPPYPLHLFSFQLMPHAKLEVPDSTDTQAVAWHSLNELKMMAEVGRFKKGYLALLEPISATLPSPDKAQLETEQNSMPSRL